MKKSFLCLSFLSFFALSSCHKNGVEMTVIKDCSGTYLRVEGEDYHVCNAEKVANFPNGTVVKALFERINSCNGPEGKGSSCYLNHENEGWVNVQLIH